MQNVLIVEDNREQIELLRNAITGKYKDWTITSAFTYDDALSYIHDSSVNNPFTLFLLDIQLTNYTTDRGGFLLAQEIRKKKIYYKTPILFLTGISDEGYFALSNFHCYNYITKPYTSDDVLKQLEQMLLTGYLESAITITDINRISYKIHVNDILYIKSNGHTKVIYLKDSYISTRECTFDELQTLSDGKLIQCHKGYLVNPDAITNIDHLTSTLHINNTIIPIGLKYQQDIFPLIHA